MSAREGVHTRVVYRARRGIDETVVYQRYYLIGLEREASLRFAGAPRRAVLAHAASRKVDLIAPSRPLRAARRLARRPRPVASGHIGRYELREHGTVRRFVIDAADNHKLLEPAAIEGADVYFKANWWPDAEYESRVLPIVNGNGFVTPRRLEDLRSLRDAPKSTDVAFISNVWGGREHNVRLFEELARANVDADLLAVIPEGGAPDEDAEAVRRLAAAGVATVRRPIDLTELWRRLARARVVVIRSGRHLCIPWRMIDLLAMGACILFDADPLPQWPVPLEAGVHYASIGIERPAWEPPAAGEYVKVRPALERLLAEPQTRASLSAAAVDYFERHARPEAVARYVLDTLRDSEPRGGA